MESLKLLVSVLIVWSGIIFLSSCSSEVKVKTGNQYEVVELPDGSEVFLNHYSSVSYDKNFSQRNIKLDGEAFFYVVKGATPFVVTTDLGEVRVLGTEFNVKADKKEMEVEVESGHVEVKAGEHNNSLKKGHRGSYNKSNNKFSKGKAEFKFRVWMQELKVEFKAIGREFKYAGKEIGKESKRLGKEVGKEGKRFGKEVGKEGKHLGKEIKKEFK